MIEPSVNAPWAKNCTITNIKATRGARLHGYPETLYGRATVVGAQYDLLMRGYHFHHASTHNGYLPKYAFAVLPYCGKYGNGYIIVTPESNCKVNFRYFLTECAKGVND